MPDLQAPEVRGRLGSVVRGEIERHGNATFKAVNLHHSGRRIAVEVTNTLISDQGQELVLSVVRDVSERKRTEEELRQIQEQLARANRVSTIGQLTASIAHELSQPIGAARNRAGAALRFLQKSPPDLREVNEGLVYAISDIDRAGKVLDRIL